MSSIENTEVYIPENAHVKNVPVQFLPSSIARKIGVHPLLRDAGRSVKCSSQTAMWICPVKLREKGASTCTTDKMHYFLTPGHFKLSVVSSNSMASKLLRKFLNSDRQCLQANDPDVPAVRSRLSSHRQHAVIFYGGHIFLALKGKSMESGLLDSQSLAVPSPASQRHQFKTLHPSSTQQGSPEQLRELDSAQQGEVFPHKISSGTVPQDEHKYGAGCPSTKECVLNVENGVHLSDEPLQENVEKCDQQSYRQSNEEDNQTFRNNLHLKAVSLTSGTKELSVAGRCMDTEPKLECRADGHVVLKVPQSCIVKDVSINNDHDQSSPAKALRSDLEGLPVISHITSLAEGWNSAGDIVNDGFSSNSEPSSEALLSCSSADGDPLKPLYKVPAEVSGHSRTFEAPPDLSLQQNGVENILSCLQQPLENHSLDYGVLKREETINLIRAKLNKMEEKLKTVNTWQ